MPEGHTIHRHARKQTEALVGQAVRTTSPQGRFAEGARRLDGRVLQAIDPHGKHLFYRWEGGDILHVHLGLFGKYKLFRADPPPPPTENTRLAMHGDDATIYLAGPTICELIDPSEEDDIRSRLGPDPLANGSRSKKFAAFQANLARRRSPIGAALLDQKVIAGIGNVYRAEALFRTGIDPHLPANRLTPDAAERLFAESSRLLKQGEKAGRIITVDLHDVGARRRSDLRRGERLYAYGRTGEPCRRCRTPISTGEMANRTMWWCSSCQPEGAGA
ncbi:MAG: Fpg/Nei family DNA glycosylase [Acidimicrobiia bacterium]|nr:Fpg/Nei family DNA glycosylase [Acidimicrobiia bacterium]